MAPFRISAKGFFVTFPRCNLDKETVITTLRGYFQDIEYIIVAHELHEDEGDHLHCLIIFENTKNLKNARAFDIDDFHPNIQSIKKPNDCLKYVTKDNDFIEWGTKPLKYFREKTPGENIFDMMISCNSKDELLSTCINKRVAPFYYQLAAKKFKKRSNTIESDYLQEGTMIEALRNLEYSDGTWVIYGDSGTGKTTWAEVNLPKPILVVTTLDILGRFDPDYHKSILFDDLSFTNYDLPNQIHFVDYTREQEVKIRYKTANIPKKTPRVFTCNEFPFSEEEPILRRVKKHKIIKL